MAGPRLFGTDGVRGTVGQWPLTAEFALRLGRAAGTVFRGEAAAQSCPLVIVGRDTRQSGPMLQSALTAGLLASGVDVMDLGVMTTPGVAWLVRSLGAFAGAVISASHNPVEQNGIKFFSSEGQKLSEGVEMEIERLADLPPESDPAARGDSHLPGSIVDGRGMRERYIEGLLAEHPTLRLDGLTLLVDCANGAASAFAQEVLTRAAARVIAAHASPTGLNINVDSGSEFVRQWPSKMRERVRETGANFGLAFDGDADRVIFVDETGTVVDGDHMLGVLARYLDGQGRLSRRSVVTTTMRNGGLKNFVEAAGLSLYETAVGDKYVVEKLIELRRGSPPQALGLGGEQSGHVVLLDDDHATGDGMRTALFVLRAFLAHGAESLAAFVASVGKTPQVIASVDVGTGPRLGRSELDELASQALRGTAGLTRINLRYSGTEPKFRAMLESDGRQSEEALAGVAHQICRAVRAAAGMADGRVEIQDCSRGGLLEVELS